MEALDTDQSWTFEQAERFLFRAKDHLHGRALYYPYEYRSAYLEALRVLTNAQHLVVQDWSTSIMQRTCGE